MKIFIKNVGLIIFMMMIINHVSGQTTPSLLKGKVEASEIIVEGQILSQKCQINSKNSEIETVSFLLVKTVFKGEISSDTLMVFTSGGVVGNTVQKNSHSLKLNIGDTGIFLLDRYNVNAYQCHNDKVGFIKQLTKDREKEGFWTAFEVEIKSWRLLLENLSNWCSSKEYVSPLDINSPGELAFDPELCVKLTNPIPLFATSQIQFDIYVKSNVAGLMFEGVQLLLEYPVDVIQANVVANGGVSATKETVALDDIYQGILEDVTSNKMRLEFTGNCQSNGNYYILDTLYEKLARVVIDVNNWGSLGEINADDFSLEGTARFYAIGNCFDFGKLCSEGNIKLTACEIKNIEVAPFAAGIGQTLRITGTGFGSTGILGAISIPNPDDGGATSVEIAGGPIINSRIFDTWTDDEIILKISSVGLDEMNGHPFGSGTWEINPDVSSTDPSTLICYTDIEIDYALLNRINNVGDNDRMISLARNPTVSEPNGTVEWYLDGGINANTILQNQGITFDNVKNVLIDVLCEWENITGIDMEYVGPLAFPDISTDDRNAVFFTGSLPNGTLADTRRKVITDACDDDFLYFKGRITEADIRFNLNQEWFVSNTSTGITDLQIDLYSVLMHEVGHALGLDHAMDLDAENAEDDNRIMYWRLRPNQIKRSIDLYSAQGVITLIQRTNESINTSGECFNGFVLDTDITGCSPDFVVDINTENNCSILKRTLFYQGEKVSFLTSSLLNQRISVFSVTGRKVLDQKVLVLADYNSFETQFLEKGIYFLSYLCEGYPVVEKFVIL